MSRLRITKTTVAARSKNYCTDKVQVGNLNPTREVYYHDVADFYELPWCRFKKQLIAAIYVQRTQFKTDKEHATELYQQFKQSVKVMRRRIARAQSEDQAQFDIAC